MNRLLRAGLEDRTPALVSGPRDPRKALVDAKSQATAKIAAYKCATKRLALQTSFLLGLAAAVVGLRTVEPSVELPSDVPNAQFAAMKILDALLTGGVIASGSEGISQDETGAHGNRDHDPE